MLKTNLPIWNSWGLFLIMFLLKNIQNFKKGSNILVKYQIVMRYKYSLNINLTSHPASPNFYLKFINSIILLKKLFRIQIKKLERNIHQRIQQKDKSKKNLITKLDWKMKMSLLTRILFKRIKYIYFLTLLLIPEFMISWIIFNKKFILFEKSMGWWENSVSSKEICHVWRMDFEIIKFMKLLRNNFMLLFVFQIRKNQFAYKSMEMKIKDANMNEKYDWIWFYLTL